MSPDIICNGRFVGPGAMDRFLEILEEVYAGYLQAHVIAPVILTRALLPGMLERG